MCPRGSDWYETKWRHIYTDARVHAYNIDAHMRLNLYFFAHMCISFPVIVLESNKTADATCPRRKTRQTNFEPRGDTKYTMSPERVAYKAEAIRFPMKH